MKTKIGFIILILVMFLFSCQNKESLNEPGPIFISGQITGLDNSLRIYGRDNSFELTKDETGSFSYQGEIPGAGFYTLTMGQEKRQEIYLRPGMDLHLVVDYNKLVAHDKTAIQISGKLTEESQLLYSLTTNRESFKYSKQEFKSKYYPMVYDRDVDDFASYNEDILQKEFKTIDQFASKHKSVSKAFVDNLRLNITIDVNRRFQMYARNQMMLKTGRTESPENFMDYFADQIPQDNMDLYEKNSTYADYLRNKYYQRLEKELSVHVRESLPYFKAKVDFLETCEYPEVIVQSMYDGLTIGYMRTRDKEIRAFLSEVIKRKVSDVETLKRWAEYKAQENAYADGDMAPDFTHKDINGNDVSLSDFRGKLVYIDLWATWCVPCLQGVPYFDKVREKYKGEQIEFLAISLDENKEAWRKKIKGDKEGIFDGIQLCTGSYKCDVSEYFVLQGIPQYVLIGADGRIIKKNAPRPHGGEIEKIIDAELKKLK